MGTRNAFAEKLALGRATEGAIARFLSNAGFQIPHEGRDASHDFCAVAPSGLVFRVEVKDESNYANSGNLCVELRQGDPPVPSGIAVSRSTVCIHVLKDIAAMYGTQEMRLFLSSELLARRFNYEMLIPIAGKSDNYNRTIQVPRRRLQFFSWYDERPIASIAESSVWRL